MRNNIGQFVGSKYKKIDGVWYKKQCDDCHEWITSHTAKLCHACRWKDKRNPVTISGKKIPHYHAVHWWMNKTFGKPTKCEQCSFESDNSRQFNWANISQQYMRVREDWLRLCVSCHKKYDNKKGG